MKLVVVSGQMRSGGSAVAEVLVALGVPMGTSMSFPIAPTFLPEWEDLDLLAAIGAYDAAREDWPNHKEKRYAHRLLIDYMSSRVQEAQRMAGVTGHKPLAIGIKTPLLLPFWAELESAAKDNGLELHRILTLREAESRAASEARTTDRLRGWRAVNDRLGGLIDVVQYETLISYEELCSNPARVTVALARIVGVDSESMIAAAIARVRQPTSCVEVS